MVSEAPVIVRNMKTPVPTHPSQERSCVDKAAVACLSQLLKLNRSLTSSQMGQGCLLLMEMDAGLDAFQTLKFPVNKKVHSDKDYIFL